MGIITELIWAARVGAVERDKTISEQERQLKTDALIRESNDMQEYRLRGERRVARICNRLFGWSIPDDLKE